jgi:hypothetical protein
MTAAAAGRSDRGRRRLRLLAIAAMLLATFAATTYSGVSNLLPGVGSPANDVSPLVEVPVVLFIWGTPILGAVLAVRRPGNLVGWLFLWMALGWGCGFASDDLARHARPGLLLDGVVTVGEQLALVGYVSLFLLLMVFPTGRLPSSCWRPFPVLAITGAAASIGSSLLTPGSPVDPPVAGVENPFAQPGLAPLVGVLATIAEIAFAGMVLGSLALLAIRMARSSGVERQQLKWFVSAGALSAGLFLAALVANVVAPTSPVTGALWSLPLASLVLLPAAATVAVLRYRLYEIDRIISRTVSYALISGLLAAVYAVAFLGLQTLLAPFTESSGPAVVAASTLLVFALFAPVRRRIGAVVDRRFNRSRYDAEREVATFAARARDETDIDRLRSAVQETVARTMAPRVVAVWTRPE